MKEFEDIATNIGLTVAEKMQNVSLSNSKYKDQYMRQPERCTPEEAAQHMIGKKNIVILTGAGLSAASGIPTFRGDNGFWK